MVLNACFKLTVTSKKWTASSLSVSFTTVTLCCAHVLSACCSVIILLIISPTDCHTGTGERVFPPPSGLTYTTWVWPV